MFLALSFRAHAKTHLLSNALPSGFSFSNSNKEKAFTVYLLAVLLTRVAEALTVCVCVCEESKVHALRCTILTLWHPMKKNDSTSSWYQHYRPRATQWVRTKSKCSVSTDTQKVLCIQNRFMKLLKSIFLAPQSDIIKIITVLFPPPRLLDVSWSDASEAGFLDSVQTAAFKHKTLTVNFSPFKRNTIEHQSKSSFKSETTNPSIHRTNNKKSNIWSLYYCLHHRCEPNNTACALVIQERVKQHACVPAHPVILRFYALMLLYSNS